LHCHCSKKASALGLVYINNKKVRRLHQREVKSREFELDVPTEYTKGGIVYDKAAKNNDFKGWSVEGIKWFNTLFATLAEEDHQANTSFTKSRLAERKAKLISATQAQKRKHP
jgi:hypothetical protein